MKEIAGSSASEPHRGGSDGVFGDPGQLSLSDLEGTVLASESALRQAWADHVAQVSVYRGDWTNPRLVEYNGRRIVVVGVIHGVVGPPPLHYRRKVSSLVKEYSGRLICEWMIWLPLGLRPVAVIPDFLVSGLLWPLEVLSLQREILRGAVSGQRLPAVEEFHRIHPEVRRGLGGGQGCLPARLELELAVRKWGESGRFACIDVRAAIALRSMYMAGFACGESVRSGRDVVLVVGDMHALEVEAAASEVRFRNHEVFLLGLRHGRCLPPVRWIRSRVFHLIQLLPIVVPLGALVWALATWVRGLL